MKLFHKKISRHYRLVHRSGKDQIHQRPYILPILGLLLGGVIVSAALLTNGNQTFRPSDSHVVFLFDKGHEQTLNTKAATVGELLAKLPLNLISQDVVEPSSDTPIVEDNFRVNIYRARPVTVMDKGVRTVTLTAQRSPREVAEAAGLKIDPEDIATFTQGNIQKNIIGEQVIVTRAVAVKLNLYGVQFPTHTLAKSVGGFLKERKITLGDGESVKPEDTTPIKANMRIFVLSKGSKLVTVEETTPAPTQTVNDPSLSFGTDVVRQKGLPGKVASTYLVNRKDGKEARQLVRRVVIVAAVPKIVAHGSTINVTGDKSAIMSAAGISSSDHGYVNYIISHENALWCPTRWQGQPNCPPTYAEKFPGAETSASLGYGLGQATPAIKMAPYGSDWRTNPVTQLKWANGYAVGRYGGWAGAYQHKQSIGWW